MFTNQVYGENSTVLFKTLRGVMSKKHHDALIVPMLGKVRTQALNVAAEQDDTILQLEGEDLLSRVNEAMKSLSEKQRKVLSLTLSINMVADLTVEQAAEILDISSDEAQLLHVSARVLLREELLKDQ